MQHHITLVVVEKSMKSQNAFRRFFEGLGTRVLVSASPARGLVTAENAKTKVDCLVVSSLELGQEAVDVFNSLAEHPLFRKMPAIIIVNRKHDALFKAVRCDDYRKVVFIPMNVPTVVSTLSEVLGIDMTHKSRGETGRAKETPTITRPEDESISPTPDFTKGCEPAFDDDMPMPE